MTPRQDPKPKRKRRPPAAYRYAAHIDHLVPMPIVRRCQYQDDEDDEPCGKLIKIIPADADPKHVRFCMAGRYKMHNGGEVDDWLGRGRGGGAGTGAYLFGSGMR